MHAYIGPMYTLEPIDIYVQRWLYGTLRMCVCAGGLQVVYPSNAEHAISISLLSPVDPSSRFLTLRLYKAATEKT